VRPTLVITRHRHLFQPVRECGQPNKGRSMKLRKWVVATAIGASACGAAVAQATKAPEAKDVNESVWFDAEIAKGNLSMCILAHAMDRDVMSDPQQPEDKVELPPPVTTVDGILVWDWPASLHARSLMEQIRQGLHKLNSVSEPKGADSLAIDQARAVWPKLRDIYCRAVPSVGYHDLDGIQRYCPGPNRPRTD
jgi:hypothetical protein